MKSRGTEYFKINTYIHVFVFEYNVQCTHTHHIIHTVSYIHACAYVYQLVDNLRLKKLF